MTNSKIAIGGALAGAFALGALAVSYSNAQSSKTTESGTFSTEEEAAVRQIVETYIEENPGFIIEALNNHVASERENAFANLKDKTKEYLPDLLSADGAYIAGATGDKAEVAVIEFFDYHCGFCKKASGLMQELANEDPSVRVVFREFPILREESELASRYALAAREQDKYQEFHFALLGSGGVLTEKRIKEIAKKAGLDTAKLEEEFSSDQTILQSIINNQGVARDLQLDGTPSFIITSLKGDFLEVIPGFDPDAVREAIKEAKKTN